MPFPGVLDFDTLLAPLGDGSPTGQDLRADSSPNSIYYTVKDARTAARATERQALLDGEEAGRPDWAPVLATGQKALAESSKDLEIAAYLIEALVRQHGFPGLRDGFHLVREMVERFWDELYPLPDEDGLETRVAPLTGLNGDDAEGTLSGPITQIPLTQGNSVGPYAHHHYQQAVAFSQVTDREARQRRIDQGVVSLEMFERAVMETPASFFVGLVEDITSCQEEFGGLCALLDEKCGNQAPPSSNIRSALAGCLEVVEQMARDKLASARAVGMEEPAEVPDKGTEATTAPSVRPQATGEIQSREEALRTLLKVADWFRRTEPHTPVSYALEQAVRWGRMSLPELLSELIPDDDVRQQLFKQVGIVQSPTDE
jgi:type VI secretion system protein ImpA